MPKTAPVIFKYALPGMRLVCISPVKIALASEGGVWAMKRGDVTRVVEWLPDDGLLCAVAVDVMILINIGDLKYFVLDLSDKSTFVLSRATTKV
jgi:hypothetical protein